MNRLPILCCCSLGLALSGCGPLQTPLPPRLDDEHQKSINESWDKALSPVDRFNNQSLLDILVLTQAYQIGIDKLEFRSEKNFSGGVVVMESRFDRQAPERDQFTVTVQDRQGQVLRQERYTREQIANTSRELGVEYETIRQKREQGTASAEEIQKLKSYEVRLALIQSVFPKLPETKAEPGDGKQKPKD
jgi:hypothetical protein